MDEIVNMADFQNGRHQNYRTHHTFLIEHILPLNQLRKTILVSNPTFKWSMNLLKLFSIAKLYYFLCNPRWRLKKCQKITYFTSMHF